MTSVLAIDPGSFQSAWLRYDGTRPAGFGITANDILVRALRTGGLTEVVVIEKVEPRRGTEELGPRRPCRPRGPR